MFTDILLALGPGWFFMLLVVVTFALSMLSCDIPNKSKIIGAAFALLLISGVIQLVKNPVSKPFNTLDVQTMPVPEATPSTAVIQDKLLKPELSREGRQLRFDETFNSMKQVQETLND